jgi:hypothetical protein
MGVASLFFEPRPSNSENQYNLWRCLNNIKIIFDISTGFRFSEISVECPVHICSFSLSGITVESGTHVKIVKIILNIFAVKQRTLGSKMFSFLSKYSCFRENSLLICHIQWIAHKYVGTYDYSIYLHVPEKRWISTHNYFLNFIAL